MQHRSYLSLTIPVMSVATVSVGIVVLSLIGCAQGTSDEPQLPDGAFVLASESFVRDVNAIGADWYDYDSTTHAVTPKRESYVVEELSESGVRYAAFRIRSYYDGETADSGRFSLSSTIFDGGAWRPEREWIVGRNVRSEGAACIDLFEREDVACENEGWQVQFRVFPLLVPEAGIVVGNPGVFVRSVAGADGLDRVRVATHSGDDLSAIPPPDEFESTDEDVAAPWNDADWDRSKFASNLPQRGMAIGRKIASDAQSPAGDVLFLMTPSQALVRVAFTLDQESEALHIMHAVAAIDLDNGVHLPFGATSETRHPLPTAGEVSYHAFAVDDVNRLDAVRPIRTQLTPPFEKDWDFAVENTAGDVRVVLSPSSAVLNTTAEGGADATTFEEAEPPLGELP